MRFNMIDSLFDPFELAKYKQLPYPLDVEYLSEKLKERLRVDKDYEVFVPLSYIRLMTHARVNLNDYTFKPEGWFVSNKGRVLTTIRSKKGKIATVNLKNSEYLEVRYVRGGKRFRMQVHRVVASTFIAPQFDLVPQYSIVRFKDENKENVHPSNLYWDGFENYH